MSDGKTLFWISARNPAARTLLSNPRNRHLRSSISGKTEAFEVALGHDSNIAGCLITFGEDGDIQLSGDHISLIQCQFFLHPITSEIMLRDKSTYESTRVRIHNTNFCFPITRLPRQIVLRPGQNVEIEMGHHDSPFQFAIEWPQGFDRTKEMERLKVDLLKRPNKSPRALSKDQPSKTKDQPFKTKDQPSETQDQGICQKEDWLHELFEKLGKGTFGTVHKTLNLHDGTFYAVKILDPPCSGVEDRKWQKHVLKEVEMLEDLSHDHIVKYQHSQLQKESGSVEIFMQLHDGTVEDYPMAHLSHQCADKFLTTLLQHCLRALMYLANRSIIHRDIKPANILYTESASTPLHFALADFGLSKEQNEANTLEKGTKLFMAPEMKRARYLQSHKSDVYSLGVTMLSVRHGGRFNQAMFSTSEEQIYAMRKGIPEKFLALVEPMLRDDPARRPSAKELYLEHFSGDGNAFVLNPKDREAPDELMTDPI